MEELLYAVADQRDDRIPDIARAFRTGNKLGLLVEPSRTGAVEPITSEANLPVAKLSPISQAIWLSLTSIPRPETMAKRGAHLRCLANLRRIP